MSHLKMAGATESISAETGLYNIIQEIATITAALTTKFRRRKQGQRDMTLKEKKLKTEVRTEVERRLAELYERRTISGKECFQKDDGTVFMISEFPSEAALVVEYSNLGDVEHDRWEDGDRIYITDTSINDILEAIIREIES